MDTAPGTQHRENAIFLEQQQDCVCAPSCGGRCGCLPWDPNSTSRLGATLGAGRDTSPQTHHAIPVALGLGAVGPRRRSLATEVMGHGSVTLGTGTAVLMVHSDTRAQQ